MGAKRMETGLEAFRDLLPVLRPESLVMLGKALQAIGEDLGAAQGGATLDRSAILPPMPVKDLSVFRVSVNRPRPGRDGGEWVLRIRQPGRNREERERTGFKACPETRTQAEELAKVRQHELNTGGSPTFVELWDAYVDHQEHVARVAPNTLVSYRASRDHLLACGLGSLTEESMNRGAVNKAKSALCRRVKSTTATKVFAHWGGCWRWAYQEERAGVPWPETKPIRINKADRSKKAAYTKPELEEVRKLFETAGRPAGRYRVFVDAMIETGARADAVSCVRGSDLAHDQESGGAWIRFPETKFGPERHVLVSPELAAQLPRYDDPKRFLWESRRKGNTRGSLNYSNVTGILRKWLKANGLFGYRDLHSLRRTAAQKLQIGGQSVEEGSRVLGQTAETFLGYSGKGHYDTRAASKTLWIHQPTDPQGTQEHETGPTTQGRRGQLLDSNDLEQYQATGVNPVPVDQPSSPNTTQAEALVLAGLRLVIGRGDGWPQVPSMISRALVRLRSEVPPT